MLSSIIAKNARFMLVLATAALVVVFGHIERGFNQSHAASEAPASNEAAPLPKIVVTLAPIHSLVAGILDGITEPQLLIDKEANHHQFNLRPADADKLRQSNLVIVTSLQAEAYIKKMLEAQKGSKTAVLEVLNIPGLTLYPSSDPDDLKDGIGKAMPDMHVWLDPMNAIAMTQYFSEKLTELLPQHSAKIMANATRQVASLNHINNEIEASFKAFGTPRQAAYMTYHNVLRYYENRYQIQGGLSLTSNPEIALSPEDAAAAENAASAGALKCLFSEKQYSAKPLRNLADKHAITILPIDAMGGSHPIGKALYFNLLRDITQNLTGCITTPIKTPKVSHGK